MKYVCRKCLNLFSETNIVRMPFTREKYWCRYCHKKWAEDNPYRGTEEKKAMVDDDEESE